MNKFNLLLIAALLPLLSGAQKKTESLLYDEKGQYRMDTTLTITDAQYEVWKRAEANIFKDCGTNIAALLKNEIKKKKFAKRVIVSFDYGAKDITNITVLDMPDNSSSKKSKSSSKSDKSSSDGPAKLVKKHHKDIYNDLKDAAAKLKDGGDFTGTYYISL